MQGNGLRNRSCERSTSLYLVVNAYLTWFNTLDIHSHPELENQKQKEQSFAHDHISIFPRISGCGATVCK